MSEQPPHAKETSEAKKTNLVQSAEQEEGAASKRENILSVKVHLTNPTVFTIGYRSPDELFRRFREKLNALGIPHDQVYWVDGMTGQRKRVDSDIAKSAFFSWMNIVDLYSPIRPKKERPATSPPRRHHQNGRVRHRSSSSSSSSSNDECFCTNRHSIHRCDPSHFPSFSHHFPCSSVNARLPVSTCCGYSRNFHPVDSRSEQCCYQCCAGHKSCVHCGLVH